MEETRHQKADALRAEIARLTTCLASIENSFNVMGMGGISFGDGDRHSENIPIPVLINTTIRELMRTAYTRLVADAKAEYERL